MHEEEEGGDGAEEAGEEEEEEEEEEDGGEGDGKPEMNATRTLRADRPLQFPAPDASPCCYSFC